MEELADYLEVDHPTSLTPSARWESIATVFCAVWVQPVFGPAIAINAY